MSAVLGEGASYAEAASVCTATLGDIDLAIAAYHAAKNLLKTGQDLVETADQAYSDYTNEVKEAGSELAGLVVAFPGDPVGSVEATVGVIAGTSTAVLVTGVTAIRAAADAGTTAIGIAVGTSEEFGRATIPIRRTIQRADRELEMAAVLLLFDLAAEPFRLIDQSAAVLKPPQDEKAAARRQATFDLHDSMTKLRKATEELEQAKEEQGQNKIPELEERQASLYELSREQTAILLTLLHTVQSDSSDAVKDVRPTVTATPAARSPTRPTPTATPIRASR
jgi:hypothetical protein